MRPVRTDSSINSLAGFESETGTDLPAPQSDLSAVPGTAQARVARQAGATGVNDGRSMALRR